MPVENGPAHMRGVDVGNDDLRGCFDFFAGMLVKFTGRWPHEGHRRISANRCCAAVILARRKPGRIGMVTVARHKKCAGEN